MPIYRHCRHIIYRFSTFTGHQYYLYLSPSGLLKVQVAGWKDGAWCITFQPTDPEDLKLLVGKDKGEAKP